MPASERGDMPMPATYAIIEEQWPHIEWLLADGQAANTISSMEALAMEMRKATVGDTLLFRDALTLARRILYDTISKSGQHLTQWKILLLKLLGFMLYFFKELIIKI